jgi:hypothetical protein
MAGPINWSHWLQGRQQAINFKTIRCRLSKNKLLILLKLYRSSAEGGV